MNIFIFKPLLDTPTCALSTYGILLLPSNFSALKGKIGLALWALTMAAISPPLHVVRAQHAFCSRAARASLLPRASSALIFPKHSPVRPRR